MKQCQHDKSHFCIVPGSPANLTKQGLLAVRSMKVPQEPILVTEKRRHKKIFHSSRGIINSTRLMCCRQQPTVPVPGQIQYPGYATGQHSQPTSAHPDCKTFNARESLQGCS